MWADFGSGCVVTLHGTEQVITPKQAEQIAKLVAKLVKDKK